MKALALSDLERTKKVSASFAMKWSTRDQWRGMLYTIQDFFVQVGYENTYAAIGNHHFFSRVLPFKLHA